jgi:hypothetical protein
MVSLSLFLQTTNGYTRASGRIRQAIESYGEVMGVTPRRVFLSPIEELDLRDLTERQAGPEGLCAARAPATSWRAFLTHHFSRRDLELHFDADRLHVS